MRKSNKLMAILMIGLVLTTTVLFAGLNGRWVGTGTGSVNWGGITFYPWQEWRGEITDSSNLRGEWWDGTYHGTFSGVKVDSSYDYVDFGFKGIWTLYYNNNYIPMDSFGIKFRTLFDTCDGGWVFDSTSDYGSITGERVP